MLEIAYKQNRLEDTDEIYLLNTKTEKITPQKAHMSIVLASCGSYM